MTTKENIVRSAIKSVSKKIASTRELMAANPIGEIIALRKKAYEIMKEHGSDHKTIARLIEPLGKEEKHWLRIAEKQKDFIKLCDKLVSLEAELYDLNTELYCINKRSERGWR